MSETVIIAIVSGFMAGALPLGVGWLINRSRGRIENDKNLWDLYEEVRDKLVTIEAKFLALERAVQMEPYEIAHRIITRSKVKVRD